MLAHFGANQRAAGMTLMQSRVREKKTNCSTR